jgi:cytochrome c-type biogenesis protein CcmH
VIVRSALILLSGLTLWALAPGELPASAPAPSPLAQAPPSTQTVVPDPDVFEAAAPTDDPELEAKVRKLARQLRCPTCQALSIADSPSELAREMEGVIRLRLQEGMTPEQVRQSFVDSYGEWVLLSPEPTGFNLLVYILPFVAVAVGGAIVVVGMRRWLAAARPEDESPSPS